jgi:hypothetical protein
MSVFSDFYCPSSFFNKKEKWKDTGWKMPDISEYPLIAVPSGWLPGLPVADSSWILLITQPRKFSEHILGNEPSELLYNILRAFFHHVFETLKGIGAWLYNRQ